MNTYYAIGDLFKCAALQKKIDVIAEQNEGEFPEELLTEIIYAQTQSIDSLQELGGFVKYLEARQNMIADRIKELRELKDKEDRLIKRVKQALTDFLIVNGKTVAGEYTFSLRKSEAVNVPDITTLPSEYVKVKVEKSADKTAIKKAIKSGLEIPGTELETKQNVQIK